MRTSLIFSFLFFINVCFGGNKVDSLIQITEQPQIHDTAKIRVLSLIGFIKPDYRLAYWDSIAKLCEKSISKHSNKEVINKLNWSYAGSLNNLGFIHNNFGNIDSSKYYFLKSINIKFKINDSTGIAQTYNNLGIIYDTQGDIYQALEYHQKSLEIREIIEDEKGMAESYNNLAYIYLFQEDTSKAIEFFNNSLELHVKTKNKIGMGNVELNLSHIYKNRGDFEKTMNLLESAKSLYIEAKDKWGEAIAYGNLGLLFSEIGNEDSAKIYYNKALILQDELGDIQGSSNTLIFIANEYIKNKNYLEAKKSALVALENANKLGFPDIIEKASYALYKIEKELANYNDALSHYEIHIQMRDSIKNEETQKVTIRQQTKYEFEKEQLIKEQQLKEEIRHQKLETERRNNLQYSFIFIAIIAVFGLVLSLGKINISPKFSEGLIFFAFLIFFEFLLVLLDPTIDQWSGGEPAYKLILNAILAATIFPLHAFFEGKLKKRITAQ